MYLVDNLTMVHFVHHTCLNNTAYQVLYNMFTVNQALTYVRSSTIICEELGTSFITFIVVTTPYCNYNMLQTEAIVCETSA